MEENRRPVVLLLVMALAGLGLLVTPLAAEAASSRPAATPKPVSPWHGTSARAQERKGEHARQVHPRKYRAYTLDGTRLRSVLGGDGALTLPAPDGKLVGFTVREDSVMPKAMQAANPDIRSYSGEATDDPGTSVRVTTGPLGVSASVRSATGGSWFLTPAYLGDQSLFLSYDRAALPRAERLREDASELTSRQRLRRSADDGARAAAAEPGAAVVERSYRVAFVNDPSYATYFTTHGCTASSDACVLAAKNTLVSRLDQVYEAELGIRLLLAAGTDTKLNLDTTAKAFGPSGPCGPTACFTQAQLTRCDVDTLDRNRVVLGQLIGASAYDLGHVTLGRPGGGIAYIGAAGVYYKAGGCTGFDPPNGDSYAVDYVAHELGHQFGANHSFGGSTSSCDGTQNFPTAVEPGSGSTIMAYAGICGRDNLQQHSDPVFSQANRCEISDYTSFGAECTDEPLPEDYTDTEVQSVSFLPVLKSGQRFTISYNGKTSKPVVGGTSAPSGTYLYRPPGIAAAVESVVGDDVEVYGFGYDPDLAPPSFNGNGFSVVFDGDSLLGTDVANLTITMVTPKTTTAKVAETDRGGDPTNDGYTQVTSDNHAPTVTAPATRTIPTRTPFTLTGQGADTDGDGLTYTWEQNDPARGATPLLAQGKSSGPLFRVFGKAGTSPKGETGNPDPGENHPDAAGASRTFPDLDQVLAGNTNARTGACPAPPSSGTVPGSTIDCFSEWLPTSTYASAMHFRLTARDGQTPGGTGHADTTVTVDRTAGPLLVTSQTSADNEQSGGTGTVTWSVNGTDKSALAPNVRISLSTDGGKTFPTVLAASTPNDGSAQVTWPENADSAQARIKVEAVGNVFFAVSSGTFSINDAPTSTIGGGPAEGTVDPNRTATFTPSSSDPDATFECRLDDAEDFTPCPTPLTYEGLRSITHTLAVRAVSDGTPDPSPATRTWTVPLATTALTPQGAWQRSASSGAFDGLDLRSTSKGATITRVVRDAVAVSLVYTRIKGGGSVDVYSGSTKVKTLYLSASSTQYKVTARVVTFAKPTTATIKIVNRSTAQVRIEGLGAPTR